MMSVSLSEEICQNHEILLIANGSSNIINLYFKNSVTSKVNCSRILQMHHFFFLQHTKSSLNVKLILKNLSLPKKLFRNHLDNLTSTREKFVINGFENEYKSFSFMILLICMFLNVRK